MNYFSEKEGFLKDLGNMDIVNLYLILLNWEVENVIQKKYYLSLSAHPRGFTDNLLFAQNLLLGNL